LVLQTGNIQLFGFQLRWTLADLAHELQLKNGQIIQAGLIQTIPEFLRGDFERQFDPKTNSIRIAG
jgi:hypothetical protein